MHKKLTLVRHGALDSSLDGCYVGRLDVPLSDEGKHQAVQLANHLAQAMADAIWCSPALRAQETSRPIAERLNLACSVMNELSEVNFGRWEGLSFEQIRTTDPHLVNEWAKMKDDFCFPQGESQAEFQQRIAQIAEKLIDCDHRHIVLVSHGGVIRALLCHLLGWPAKDYLKFEIKRGGLVTLNLYADGAVFTGLYDAQTD